MKLKTALLSCLISSFSFDTLSAKKLKGAIEAGMSIPDTKENLMPPRLSHPFSNTSLALISLF